MPWLRVVEMVAIRVFCGVMAVLLVVAACAAFEERAWPFVAYSVIALAFSVYGAFTYRPYISPPGVKRWNSDDIGDHF